jgi:hypothetical protein
MDSQSLFYLISAVIGIGLFCGIPVLAAAIIVLIVRRSRSASRPTQPTTQPAANQTSDMPTLVHALKPTIGSKPVSAAPIPNPTVRAPITMTAPVSAKDFTPIYLTLSDKPQSIIQGMDNLVAQIQTINQSNVKWKRLPRLISMIGVFLILVDIVLRIFGYKSLVFTLGGILSLIAAFVFGILLRRHKMQSLPPRFGTVKEIIYTLRDDLRPDGTFLGHVDLTGPQQPTKVANETQDARNRTTQYFRDEWLNLKAKMYDGNILRLSAVQRTKLRKGYWKRSSISGKMKWKPPKHKGSYQELKLRIAVNPQVYEIVRNGSAELNKNIGEYTISQLDTEEGLVTLVANTSIDNVSANSVLGVMREAYNLLQRKAA